MRDRTPKMLDFLGLAFQGRYIDFGPKASGCPLEHVNLAARGREVKHLFVKGMKYDPQS
jgi:hypothetical protein